MRDEFREEPIYSKINSEIKEILDRLTDKLRRGNMSVDDIREIFEGVDKDNYGNGNGNGNFVNYYPCKDEGYCADTAIFVSLTLNKKGRGHLSFYGMMSVFVQHMQGRCPNTHHAILYADSINPIVIDDWKYNIERIRQYATVDLFLFDGTNYNLMSI